MKGILYFQDMKFNQGDSEYAMEFPCVPRVGEHIALFGFEMAKDDEDGILYHEGYKSFQAVVASVEWGLTDEHVRILEPTVYCHYVWEANK